MNARLRRRREGRAADEGVTLVELIMAIFIGTVITGAVANALIVGFRTTDQTTDRLGESHDTQLVATWFPNDVASAAPTGISTASSAAGCAASGPGINVVALLYSAGPDDDQQSTSYRFEESTEKLIRHHCGPDGEERIVVATRVSAAAAEISPPQGEGQKTVTLTVTATPTADATAPSTFTVTGHSRTPTPPSPMPTAPEPPEAPSAPCRFIDAEVSEDIQLESGTSLEADVLVGIEVEGACLSPLALSFVPGDGARATEAVDGSGDAVLGASEYAWTPGEKTVTVEHDGGVAVDTFTFIVSGPAPTITSAAPPSLGVGADDRDVVLTGTNFVASATVAFADPGIDINSTTFDSATRITVNVDVTDTAEPGAVEVTVDNNDASGDVSSTTVFSINAAPTVASIEPVSAPSGSSGVSLVITGTGFAPNLTVAFEKANGGVTVVSATVDSSTQVTVVVDVGSANPVRGRYDVVLTNADGGTVTATRAFEVTA